MLTENQSNEIAAIWPLLSLLNLGEAFCCKHNLLYRKISSVKKYILLLNLFPHASELIVVTRSGGAPMNDKELLPWLEKATLGDGIRRINWADPWGASSLFAPV